MESAHSVSIRFSEDSRFLGGREPDDYIYETRGEIIIYPNEDQGFDDESVVGRFRALYVDLDRALDEGEAADYVLDAEQGTLELYETLFKAGGTDLSAKASRVVDSLDSDYYGQSFLILDRIEILPTFRGQGIGLAVLRELMWRCGRGAGFAALKAFPLQFESSSRNPEWREQLALTAFPKDERAASSKLRRYYGLLGFVRVPGTPYMIAASNPST